MDVAGKRGSPPLGVALIGAGMVAGTHLAAIDHARDHVILRGVLSRRAERAETLLEGVPDNYPCAPRVYRDLDQLIADDTVDAVVVLTPANVRLDLIGPIAASGRHILLEKPVARTLAEAEAVVDLCENAGIHLGIVFQHRFREASLSARRLIEDGGLGRLGAVEVAVPWWRDQSYYDEPGRGTYERDGGGVLISQAIHTIDLMLSLTGAVSRVQALTGTSLFHKMEAEDFAVAGLKFTNGAIGSFTASTCSFPGSPESLSLHFEKAGLHLAGGILTVRWRDGNTETFGAGSATGGGADPMAFTHEWHQSVLENFADAVRRGVSPAITGREALAAHRLIHAIEQSARNGRVWELPG
ncbi:Gfo/Idh/MocA family oxidoreductase [Labrenzia sp. 011]|uniref:Gfo/Idh/MocA family protein n=1 Tax=Labrenzia sp. 011 TaxID=2171494 RepID=UPI000D506114|nr:Gfo/Idh/MocA family oxidoreductase [Labrenzia sp. 011]PVB62155.1 oxidoreductase [Labrenzia sp. 011]